MDKAAFTALQHNGIQRNLERGCFWRQCPTNKVLIQRSGRVICCHIGIILQNRWKYLSFLSYRTKKAAYQQRNSIISLLLSNQLSLVTQHYVYHCLDLQIPLPSAFFARLSIYITQSSAQPIVWLRQLVFAPIFVVQIVCLGVHWAQRAEIASIQLLAVYSLSWWSFGVLLLGWWLDNVGNHFFLTEFF